MENQIQFNQKNVLPGEGAMERRDLLSAHDTILDLTRAGD
jgi:hypothetical protein